MSKQLKRLSLIGVLPFCAKYLNNNNYVSAKDKLKNDGYVESIEKSTDTYLVFYRDEIVEISENGSIPVYKGSEINYWIWDKVIKRNYIYYFNYDKVIESRGEYFLETKDSQKIYSEERKWYIF